MRLFASDSRPTVRRAGGELREDQQLHLSARLPPRPGSEEAGLGTQMGSSSDLDCRKMAVFLRKPQTKLWVRMQQTWIVLGFPLKTGPKKVLSKLRPDGARGDCGADLFEALLVQLLVDPLGFPFWPIVRQGRQKVMSRSWQVSRVYVATSRDSLLFEGWGPAGKRRPCCTGV